MQSLAGPWPLHKKGTWARHRPAMKFSNGQVRAAAEMRRHTSSEQIPGQAAVGPQRSPGHSRCNIHEHPISCQLLHCIPYILFGLEMQSHRIETTTIIIKINYTCSDIQEKQAIALCKMEHCKRRDKQHLHEVCFKTQPEHAALHKHCEFSSISCRPHALISYNLCKGPDFQHRPSTVRIDIIVQVCQSCERKRSVVSHL